MLKNEHVEVCSQHKAYCLWPHHSSQCSSWSRSQTYDVNEVLSPILQEQREEPFLFGYNTVTIYGKCTSDFLLDYSWPRPDGTVGFSSSLVAVDVVGPSHFSSLGNWILDLISDFDEGSSRVVMCSCRELVVFDFA